MTADRATVTLFGLGAFMWALAMYNVATDVAWAAAFAAFGSAWAFSMAWHYHEEARR